MSNILDPAVTALIQAAVDDTAAAGSADADDAKAVQAVQAAQSIEDGAKAASIAAHKTALQSSAAAIAALAKALNYPLPAPTP